MNLFDDIHKLHSSDGLIEKVIQNPSELSREEFEIALMRIQVCPVCHEKVHQDHKIDAGFFEFLYAEDASPAEIRRNLRAQIESCKICRKLHEDERKTKAQFPESVKFSVPPKLQTRNNWVWLREIMKDTRLRIEGELQGSMRDSPTVDCDQLDAEDFTNALDNTGEHKIESFALSDYVLFCVDKSRGAIILSLIMEYDLGFFELFAGAEKLRKIPFRLEELDMAETLGGWHYKYLVGSCSEFLETKPAVLEFRPPFDSKISLPIDWKGDSV